MFSEEAAAILSSSTTRGAEQLVVLSRAFVEPTVTAQQAGDARAAEIIADFSDSSSAAHRRAGVMVGELAPFIRNVYKNFKEVDEISSENLDRLSQQLDHRD
ncbi:MAG: hypothetical protein ACRC0L_07360 [Angustibacter sp.]